MNKLDPINQDLYLASSLIHGGHSPVDIINNMNNIKNKYLKSIDGEFILEFINDNKYTNYNDKYSGTDSKYYAKGSYTAVFIIRKIKGHSHLQDILVLKAVDEDINKYIQKWKEDKLLLPNNIPDIYLYGNIYNDDHHIASYIITKLYTNIKYLQNIKEKIEFTNSMFEALIVLEKNKIAFRDLKASNIGYEIKENKPIFIILDHDIITLLKYDDPFFDDEYYNIFGCIWLCTGTLQPLYTIADTLSYIHKYINNDYSVKSINKAINEIYTNKIYNDKSWKLRLDKIHVLGVAEILILLFFENGMTFVKKYIYTPKPHDIFGRFIAYTELLNNNDNYNIMIKNIKQLDSDNFKKYPILKLLLHKLIEQLINSDYNKILSMEKLSYNINIYYDQ